MSITENALRRPVTALAILALASVGLTACGSSSGTAPHTNAAAAATGTDSASTSGATNTHPGSDKPEGAPTRFRAIRICLQKNGIALPQPTRGGPPPGPGAFHRARGHAGAPQLPKGVTRTQLQTALEKCGAGNTVARNFGSPNGPHPENNPGFRQALTRYAACLRQNGVNIPAPNTSGSGPIFSTKGLNPRSPQFRAATMKCRSTLIGAFRHSGVGKTTGPTGSRPPTG